MKNRIILNDTMGFTGSTEDIYYHNGHVPPKKVNTEIEAKDADLIAELDFEYGAGFGLLPSEDRLKAAAEISNDLLYMIFGNLPEKYATYKIAYDIRTVYDIAHPLHDFIKKCKSNYIAYYLTTTVIFFMDDKNKIVEIKACNNVKFKKFNNR